MDDAHSAALPRRVAHPHHCWLAYTIAITPPHLLLEYQCRHVTHRVLFTTAGGADITWTRDGVEAGCRADPETVAFFPHDGSDYLFTFVSAAGYRGHVICLPIDQLGAHHATARPALGDRELTACLHRLAVIGHGCPLAEDVGDEVVARRILVRLDALLGCAPSPPAALPRGFSAAVMRQLVGAIDAELICPPSTRSLGLLVELSPSHFARKFLQSTGLSLNRFVNLRRVRRSLLLMEETALPLSQIALGLGFSSQSHFTRLFSGLTGLTPSQFRRTIHAADP